VHDCFLNVFFSLSPSFFASELDWCLPAEDALWNATSSQEWYSLLRQPSPYGPVATRLTGLGIKAALAVLGDMHMPSPALALSSFAHFVLINTILGSIFRLSGVHGTHISEPAADRQDIVSGEPHDFVLQYTLHNWLQGWVNTSDGGNVEEAALEPPHFTRDAVPYYWLAQAALIALQEDVSGSPAFFITPDTRFRVLGQWLLHIRDFLRSGQSDSTRLWLDLMKVVAVDGHEASMSAEEMEALRPG
jgi:hypothetical protein